ncbi:DNA recombination protein RmuC [Sulfitobacter geojensis]|uniref:DNA recombination protein RmuC homolog n=1 Tax=Sulfitobacter geojensis TaxID=1342299 RepID=A0AAE2VZ10_9RHOB|nr:DNA recombination protein RmuC [Sulfitobacter geojensis]MBM1689802.1 DNA recombination protein RmuC [Sulfitobacter geojensis]MBM1693868.1 DNA recombination protein RmuC [Sulfitobacter geojensis]MBM1706034.1 DNA recombination protein RmuC [Sulfitobacter geojensis]MBM1710092.1 DNA recombination protein RmuC [Sulfitobacter geojensis]MBM1714158.1 DNA recombination protein RmuC [Sulfitobacter geojensis]
MIQINGQPYTWDDPIIMAALIAGAAVLLILILLIVAVRAAGRSARIAAPLGKQIQGLGGYVQQLGAAQERLQGGLQTVSDTQANAQAQLIQSMEARLAHVQQNMQDRLADNAAKSARALAEMQERMNATLHGNSKQTTTSLTQLQERLASIDKAQDNITKLSGDVLSLQDILSNKQTRGNFGEIQLHDIVSKALPADAYSMQSTLSNGKRPDCLIHLPNPPGPIVIDSKFPLEAYEALRRATTDHEAKEAARAMRVAVKVHIDAIATKYIIDGETAEGALMFLPSEAVYAELHANFGEITRYGFEKRVWIVSPTTCMATLNTMRAILKDARMREQAGAIRKELGLLNGDVERLVTRVGNLDRHFGQARKDVDEILVSSEKAAKRSGRLHNFDFEELGDDKTARTVVPLLNPER